MTTATAARRHKRRLLFPPPFLLATLLLFLAGSVVRPGAAEGSADGDGDTPVLIAAVGQVPVPPPPGDGGDVSPDEPASEPEGLYFFLTAKVRRPEEAVGDVSSLRVEAVKFQEVLGLDFAM